MTVAAVIFDMDGLLLDTERVCLDAFVQACLGYGIKDSEAVFLQCVGHRGDAVDIIVEKALSGKVGLQTFYQDWGALIDQKLDQNIPVKAGVLKLLSFLKTQDIPMAVATSTKTKSAVPLLEKAGLMGFFAHVVGGEQVEHGKPQPDIYIRAAKLLGVDIAKCVAFEDSNTGVLAAVRSGAKAVQVPDLLTPSEEIKALGHIIAPDILEGAKRCGFVEV